MSERIKPEQIKGKAPADGASGPKLKGLERRSGNRRNASRRNSDTGGLPEQTAAGNKASSMATIAGAVRRDADNARQLVIAAREQAGKGGEVMDRAVGTLAAIHSTGKEIADLIDVIDDLAFQADLLGLHAAVEAARAGKRGRGFAVIAEELRSLATRSADAATEIRRLIEKSGDKVDEGVRLIHASGKALEAVVDSAGKAAGIIAEIAAASEE